MPHGAWASPPASICWFVGLDSFAYRLRDEHSLFSENTDVTIFVGVAPADVIFVDSFESGDTTAWTLSLGSRTTDPGAFDG